jgi:hypothetical protein
MSHINTFTWRYNEDWPLSTLPHKDKVKEHWNGYEQVYGVTRFKHYGSTSNGINGLTIQQWHRIKFTWLKLTTSFMLAIR